MGRSNQATRAAGENDAISLWAQGVGNQSITSLETAFTKAVSNPINFLMQNAAGVATRLPWASTFTCGTGRMKKIEEYKEGNYILCALCERQQKHPLSKQCKAIVTSKIRNNH